MFSFLCLLASCGVEPGDPGGGECGVSPPSPIRRLNQREYDSTVRDLLGDDSRPATEFPPDEEALGFRNNAEALGVTELLAEQYLLAAEALSVRATENLQGLLQCDPGGGDELGCVREFLTRFGRRAWRRPLTAGEASSLLGVYQAARATGDVRAAIQVVLQVMLQSPHFLYRVETGREVDPWAMASRLSYFLWGSLPDDELFAAAAEGRLASAADVEAQARRMLLDPRARATVLEFHRQWLQLADLDQLEKEAEVFPEFTPAVRDLLRGEAERFIDHVVWDGEGDLGALLGAPYTFLNAPLAAYYGLAGPSGDAFERVDLPSGRGAGLLGQGGLMALHAKPNQTSPIHRGKFVRERLFCQLLPPPPEGIVITPPEPDPSLSTRERFAEHSANPACAGCHGLMDPIGFGFEHFDGIGRYRELENGLPIDASGELTGTDVDGPFAGVPDLAARLAESRDVRACVTVQWFRFAYGRGETAADACTLAALEGRLSESALRLDELLIALTQTDAFLHRTEQP